MEVSIKAIGCPYCGETIDIQIDNSMGEQDYYEDCSVCCRPIRFLLKVNFEGQSEIAALRDDE
ncbi:hypothetical protein MNBD_GAMMA05-1711 [hydrothermal vent metagenome]|uniref:CPXCG motif-containing cysteine-rich protein n=1 Tax=hydrothermal vent metagenome TaxID=652676 RepID=A0A3B0WQ38_9ZZZZ